MAVADRPASSAPEPQFQLSPPRLATRRRLADTWLSLFDSNFIILDLSMPEGVGQKRSNPNFCFWS